VGEQVLCVYEARTEEDLRDVARLLPHGTKLPGSTKMTYCLARLESTPGADAAADERIAAYTAGTVNVAQPAEPPVGCLMATLSTNMIATRIFHVEDRDTLEGLALSKWVELWGFQVRRHRAVW
jgi:hypothetical protein